MASIAENKFALQFVDPTVSFDPIRGTATGDIETITESRVRFPQPTASCQFHDDVSAIAIKVADRRYVITFDPATRIVEHFGYGPNPSALVFELADIESIVMDRATR